MERSQGKSPSPRALALESWVIHQTREALEALKKNHPQGQGVGVLMPHMALLPSMQDSLLALYPKLTLTTLPIMAENVSLKGSQMEDFERQHLIYDALRTQNWFDESQRWTFAEEAVKLMDELTLYGVVWPDSQDEWTQTLAQAYESVVSAPLQFEARVIHTLWQVLHGSNTHLSPAIAYLERLKRLSQESTVQAWVVLTQALRYPAEKQCVAQWAQRLPVIEVSQPHPPYLTASRQWLQGLWWRTSGSLQTALQGLKGRFPESPLVAKLKLVACSDLENEVRVAQSWVQERLNGGHKKVLVVAQDRELTRRLRAKLFSCGIACQDQSGWVMSTTRVAAAVHVCLNLIQQGPTRQGFFELFALPWLLAQHERPENAWLLRQVTRHLGGFNTAQQFAAWVADTSKLSQLDSSEMESLNAHRLVALIDQGLALFTQQKNSLSGWLSQLLALFDLWLMTEGLEKDEAGAQLIDLLKALASSPAHQQGSYRFIEWSRWLEEILETQYFIPQQEGGAPVMVTQLSQCLYLSSTATLVLGVDKNQLPFIPSQAILGEGVRRNFNLPVREHYLDRATHDLLELIDHSQEMLMTYRPQQDGVSVPLSPMVEWLIHAHQSLYGISLMTLSTSFEEAPVSPQVVAQSAVIIPPERVPLKVSASFYQRVMDCPYRSFVYDLLSLREPFPKSEDLNKADLGQLVHGILKDCALYQREHHASWQESLNQASQKHWPGVLKQHPQWKAWYFQWLSLLPDLTRWFDERHQEGWSIDAVEKWYHRVYQTKGGVQIELGGYIDRWDRRVYEGQEQIEILDYKFKSARQLTKKDIESGEDVQLSLYVQLLNVEAIQASYVPLQDQPIKEIKITHLKEVSERVMERWLQIVDDTQQATPWPANAQESICEYCDFSGLCRRQHWSGHDAAS